MGGSEPTQSTNVYTGYFYCGIKSPSLVYLICLISGTAHPFHSLVAMGPLLGKPKKEMPAARPAAAEVTSKDRATLDLKVARDKLKKYQKRVCVAIGCIHSNSSLPFFRS